VNEVELHVAEVYLDGLIERVERGETVTITRDGVPVARVVPADDHGPTPGMPGCCPSKRPQQGG
jgi:prevent-host-death family protein